MDVLAFYLRVSTPKQVEEGISLDHQLEKMHEYAKKHRGIISDENVFVEKGKTGTNDNRPEFQRMVTLGLRNPPPFSKILVWSFSRFARDQEDSIINKMMLKRNGVSVVSINPGEDIPEGDFAFIQERLIENADDRFSRSLSINVKSTFISHSERGYWLTSRYPFGYKLIHEMDGKKERKKLKIDPPNAGLVEKMFALSDRGLSVKRIRKAMLVDGEEFTDAMIYGILHNRHYCGDRVIRSKISKFNSSNEPHTIIENTHPPIIDRRLFERVQRKMRKHKKSPETKGLVGNKLFTGLITCVRCGLIMCFSQTKSQKKGSDSKLKYYGCKHQCQGRLIKEDKLLDLILDAFEKTLFDEKILKKAIEEAEELRKKNSAAEKRERLSVQLEDLRLRRERLIEQIEEGTISKELIKERMATLGGKINSLESKLEYEYPIAEKNITLKDAQAFVAVVKRDLKKTSKRFYAMRSIINRIEFIYPKIVIHTTVLSLQDRIEINYIEPPEIPKKIGSCTIHELRSYVRKIRYYENDKSHPSRRVSKWTRADLCNYISRYRSRAEAKVISRHWMLYARYVNPRTTKGRDFSTFSFTRIRTLQGKNL